MTFRKRFVAGGGHKLFVRNACASIFTFLIDLALIWLLMRYTGMNRFVAVTIGFLFGNACHYALARLWVFRDSLRGVWSGYALFLGNALLGLVFILGAFALMTDWLGVPLIVARITASLIAGVGVFMLNATVNFQKI